MRRLIFFVVWLSVSALADEKSKAQKIEQLLQLTNAESLMKSYVNMTMEQLEAKKISSMIGIPISPQMEKQLQELRVQIGGLFERTLSWEKLKAPMVQIYGEAYSEEQLDGMLAFYRSPIGKSLLEKTPVVLKKSNELSQKLMIEIQPEIQAMIRKSLDSLIAPEKP